MRRRLLSSLAALTMLFGAASGVARSEVIDRVLAIVDGHLITLSDVRRALALHLVSSGDAPSGEAAALERLIDRVLILQEVERYAPPEPDRAAIDAQVRELERPFATGELASRLSAVGASDEWLRQWVRDDLRMQAYVEQRFTGAAEPTDEELENYFRQHADEFTRNGQEMSDASARQLARTRVIAVRRQVVVTDWLAGLKRRADIIRPVAR